MNYVTLNNGFQMPLVGYGVFEIPADHTARCVFDALETGYRLIDTAQEQLRTLDENRSMWAEYDDPMIVQYAMETQ